MKKVGFLQTVLKTTSNKWKKTCQKMSVSGWIASVPLGSHSKASLGVGLFDREINIRVSYGRTDSYFYRVLGSALR